MTQATVSDVAGRSEKNMDGGSSNLRQSCSHARTAFHKSSAVPPRGPPYIQWLVVGHPLGALIARDYPLMVIKRVWEMEENTTLMEVGIK